MRKVGFNFVIVAATILLFAVVGVLVAVSSASLMEREARHTVENVVEATVQRIDRVLSDVETAVANSVWVIQEHLDDADYMYRIVRQLVANNDFIVGSAIAFRENFYAAHGLQFSPYAWKNQQGVIETKQLGTATYRYHEMEWFKVPFASARPRWCEPYFDDGGGEVMMCTFSMPVLDAQKRVVAIVTSDISLANLTRHVAKIRPYADSYAVLSSKEGKPLVPRPAGVDEAQKMVAMSRTTSNGWTMTLNCPMANILDGSRRMVLRMLIFGAIGLALLFGIAWFFMRRLERQEADAARMHSELSIATDIQMGMLNHDFPPFLHAALRPAREVGGDFYDFFEHGDRLYFAIGDVSGKGVPAALITFTAASTFRMAADLELSAGELASRVNSQLAHNNESCMFMTFFVGIYNRRTGMLECCNAGHNPPVLIAADGKASFVEGMRNMAMGAIDGFPYVSERWALKPGERLVLYTDGITEAERIDHEQYGDQRLLDLCERHASDGGEALVASAFEAVREFAGEAEQFDDQTMLELDFNIANSLVVETGVDGKETSTEGMQKVAAFVEENLGRSGCSADVLAKMMIATDEIVANVFSYSNSPDLRVDFSCEGHPAVVRLVFSDSGKPYNPLEHSDPDINASLEDRPIGGLGILIVKNLADEVRYCREDNRNILSITCSLVKL